MLPFTSAFFHLFKCFLVPNQTQRCALCTNSRAAQLGTTNVAAIGLLALHGYTSLDDAAIPGASQSDPQQFCNALFHVSAQYDAKRDGFVSGIREKRKLLNQLGGAPLALHLSEQWLSCGSGQAVKGPTQNSLQAMADIVGIIATLQNAEQWFPAGAGGGYALHCINASPLTVDPRVPGKGPFDPQLSYPVGDFMFGYGKNADGVTRLHRTGRQATDYHPRHASTHLIRAVETTTTCSVTYV